MKKSHVAGFCLTFAAAFLFMCSVSLLWRTQDNASDAIDSVESLKSQVDDLNSEIEGLKSRVGEFQTNANYDYRR